MDTHLGQLLTYAAGLNAVTVVWIAQRFTEEHRAALDWLNEHTDDSLRFFGLEIELWRIGVNMVCKPNDWSAAVKKEATKATDLSSTRQKQLRFWIDFKQFLADGHSPLLCTSPAPQNWMTHPLGRSGVYLTSVISTHDKEAGKVDGEIRAEVYLDGPSARQRFVGMQPHREAVETALGFPLNWVSSEDRTRRRIFARRTTDFRNEALWPGTIRMATAHAGGAP